jgi:hypothetical protein
MTAWAQPREGGVLSVTTLKAFEKQCAVLTKAYTISASTLLPEVVQLLSVQHVLLMIVRSALLLLLLLKHDLLPAPMRQPWL